MSGPRSSLKRCAALLWAAALLSTGCASLPPPREPLSPEAHRLIALLQHRWQEFDDLRTLVEITIQRLMDVVIKRGKSFSCSTDTGAA